MEGKLNNYQSRVKLANQENEGLKDTVAQSKQKQAEMVAELSKLHKQIRYATSGMADRIAQKGCLYWIQHMQQMYELVSKLGE